MRWRPRPRRHALITLATAGPWPARRFSAKRKLAAVQRLMRGESLEAVSRNLNVPVHRLSEWRDKALMAAEGSLKEHALGALDEIRGNR